MISWNNSDIAKCMCSVIDLHKNHWNIDGEDAAALETMAEGLNKFLKQLSPMIGDAAREERKRGNQKRDTTKRNIQKPKNQSRNYYAKAEVMEGSGCISCWINGNTFDVGINDIIRFSYLMDMLKREIANKSGMQFNIVGIEENTQSSFGRSPVDVDTAIKSPNAIKGNESLESLGKDNPSISISARKGLLVSDNRSVLTAQEQTITVEAVSQWATALISGYLRDFDEEKPWQPGDGTVQSIYHRSWTSLWELVRSIFVTYYAAYGDFSRLKICKECGELFYEKRSNRKDFCSTSCRVKHNQAGEDPEKLKCRMRQNAWARNTIKSGIVPWTVIKDECIHCPTGTQKGGNCKIILNKNKKALKDISKNETARAH